MATNPAEATDRPLSPRTALVLDGRPPRRPDGPVNPEIVLSSTYHAGGEVGYARTSNPTWEALEQVLGSLEGGRALTYASGMAAVSAVLSLLAPGATVLTPTHLYNGVDDRLHALAERGEVSRVEADITDAAALADAIAGARPDLVWLESPTNPMLEVGDIAAAAAAAHAVGALVACDSTFATPLRQNPLALGADLVVHSATKYLAGHSDVLLGVVVTADDDLLARLHRGRTLTGAIPGPTEAWLALRGVRTLAVRLDRAEQNAGELARRLAAHPAVIRVRYPGLPQDPGHELAGRQMRGPGAMLSFETVGGAADAQAVCERTRLWLHATSLGGVESSLERRRHWDSERKDIPATLIRASVGIEDVEDLWADLAAALDPAVPQ
ncbi:MAG TPA: PLP-dependent aspartate aminotransferase family protein [Candidatus Nanopelagicales bacterium]|jgi:cystathionine gamma-synthase|nr:PLP-dependent aspartate aminotransferase family protein [Candidatus Nanopelagicales bacterium]